MNKKPMKRPLIALLIFGASTLLFSCEDAGELIDGGTMPGKYHYDITVPNADDELTIVIDSVTSPIKHIGPSPDWVNINATDDMQEGHPTLKLTLKESEPNTMNACEILLKSEAEDEIILSLTQSIYIVNNANSSEDFITDWENQETVTIYSERAYQQIPTPWADASITTLPEDVRYDVKKKDGWEMAFSFLSNETFDDCNYFALYNRYLGILRVFLYVTDSASNASEYSFEVDMGSNSKRNKFPFYHSLAYGIPTCYNSIPNNVNLLGSGISSQFTFKSFYSPYRSVSSTVLSKGWTAFDIDASAYCPSDVNWLDSGEQMLISCRTVQNQSITLAGSITANISGKYSSAEQTVSASSGVSSLLSTAGSILGDVQNSALAAIEKQVTGSSLDLYCYYAGAACNVASFIYDYITGDDYKDEAVIDSMPGKIEMSMTGDIDLSGYITSLTSNPIKPVTLKGSTIRNTNAESHFGQGVWNLQKSPVIYVFDDCFFGNPSRVNLVVNGDGTYGNSEAEDLHLRMISFLDPLSLDVDINSRLFPDITDVRLVWNYGVYPDVEKGHTEKYASLLGLDRPTIRIVNNKEVTVYRSGQTHADCMKYVHAPDTLFMSRMLEESPENCEVIKQAGADYSYYGRQVNIDGKNVIMQPQVFFPVKETDKGIVICDGEIPDFVVFCTLTFKS